MPILKSVSSAGKSASSLKRLIDYVSDRDDEKVKFGKFNINGDPFKEMINTKKLWHKEEGRQYKHLIISFKPGEVDMETANKFVLDFCSRNEKLKNHEVLIATHGDRNHIHSHLVINSVDFATGEKYSHSKKELEEYKKIVDELAREYDLEIPLRGLSRERTLHKEAVYNLNEYKARGLGLGLGEGYGWKDKIKEKFLRAYNEKPESIEDLNKKMESDNITITKRGKNYTLTLNKDGKEHKIRLTTLLKDHISDITPESLERTFSFNKTCRIQEENRREEIKNKMRELDFLNKKIENKEFEYRTLENKIAEKKEEKENLINDNEWLESDNQTLKTKNEELRRESRSLDEELKEKYKLLKNEELKAKELEEIAKNRGWELDL